MLSDLEASVIYAQMIWEAGETSTTDNGDGTYSHTWKAKGVTDMSEPTTETTTEETTQEEPQAQPLDGALLAQIPPPPTTFTIPAGDTIAVIEHASDLQFGANVQLLPPDEKTENWIVSLSRSAFQVCLAQPADHDITFTWQPRDE